MQSRSFRRARPWLWGIARGPLIRWDSARAGLITRIAGRAASWGFRFFFVFCLHGSARVVFAASAGGAFVRGFPHFARLGCTEIFFIGAK